MKKVYFICHFKERPIWWYVVNQSPYMCLSSADLVSDPYRSRSSALRAWSSRKDLVVASSFPFACLVCFDFYDKTYTILDNFLYE